MEAPPVVQRTQFTSSNKRLIEGSLWGIPMTGFFIYTFATLILNWMNHRAIWFSIIVCILTGFLVWVFFMRILGGWNQVITVTPVGVEVKNGKGKLRAGFKFVNVVKLQFVQPKDSTEPTMYTVYSPKGIVMAFGPEVENHLEMVRLIEQGTGKKFENSANRKS